MRRPPRVAWAGRSRGPGWTNPISPVDAGENGPNLGSAIGGIDPRACLRRSGRRPSGIEGAIPPDPRSGRPGVAPWPLGRSPGSLVGLLTLRRRRIFRKGPAMRLVTVQTERGPRACGLRDNRYVDL